MNILCELECLCFGSQPLAGTREWYRDASVRLRRCADLLPDLLSVIGSNEEIANAIASASSRHVNGFFKLVLGGSPSSGRLRLHVWPDETREGIGDPHDHRWAFASLILVGRFREARFVRSYVAASPCGEMFDLHQCFPRDLEHTIRLEHCKSAYATLSTTHFYDTGQTYFCDPEDVHQFGPSHGGMAATLVLTAPALKPAASVFKANAINRGSIPVPALSSEQVIQVALDLSEALAVQRCT